MLFDLRPISSTVPRLAPRLEVSPEQVLMVRRLPVLPSRPVLSYRRDQLDSVRFYGGEELKDSGLLEFVEERAVEDHMQQGRERFLVLVFEDNKAWVLEGADHELERARTALLVPTRNLEAVAEPRPEPVPERPPASPALPWLIRIGVICGVLGTLLLIIDKVVADDDGSITPAPAGAGAPASALPPAVLSAPGRVIAPPPDPPAGSSLAAAQLPRAAAQLTRRLGRRPGVYRILAGDQQATFEVYLPGRTDAIEGWVWRAGALTGPVEITAAPLPNSRFALNDVRLSRVTSIVQDAKQRARVGAPAVERANVVIRRGLPDTRALRIRTTISGPGGERTFVARAIARP